MLRTKLRLSSCLLVLGSMLLLVGCGDSSEKNNEELAKSRDAQSQSMGSGSQADMKAKYDAAKSAGQKTGP